MANQGASEADAHVGRDRLFGVATSADAAFAPRAEQIGTCKWFKYLWKSFRCFLVLHFPSRP